MNKMYKILILISILIFTDSNLFAQYFNIKIKLYILNQTSANHRIPKHKIKKYSQRKIVTKDFEGFKLDTIIKALPKKKSSNSDSLYNLNYTSKCIITYNLFRRKVIYFTDRGAYLYKKHKYKKDFLYEAIYYNLIHHRYLRPEQF